MSCIAGLLDDGECLFVDQLSACSVKTGIFVEMSDHSTIGSSNTAALSQVWHSLDKELLFWGAFLIFLLYLDPGATGFSFCPWTWFGKTCPGCGLTRSMAAALDFEYLRSFRLHRLGMFALLAIGLRFVTLLRQQLDTGKLRKLWTS